MNIVFLQGNWARDPDLRYTDNGRPFALCTIAVDRLRNQGKEKVTDFIPVIVGGALAESIAEQTKKGTAVWILGSLRTRTYQDGTGKKRFAMDVNAWRVGVILTNGKKRNLAQNGTGRDAAGKAAFSSRQEVPPAVEPEPLGFEVPDLPEDLFDTETGEFSEDDLPF